jgi:hypothetical protein
MSHHLGTTEDEATAIQHEVIRFFKGRILEIKYEESHRQHLLGDADVFRTTLLGLSVRLRGGEPIMCASTYLAFAGNSLTGGTSVINGNMYLTKDLYEKWSSSNWDIIKSISDYICSLPGRGGQEDYMRLNYQQAYERGNIKFTSEADIANYIDGLQDDLKEYVKQVQTLDLKYKIVDELPWISTLE